MPGWMRWMAVLVAWTSLLTLCLAQTLVPSNYDDLNAFSTSPRFLLNGSDYAELPAIRLAPLGPYAYINHQDFIHIRIDGYMVGINTINGPFIQYNDFVYMSCDPSAYRDGLTPTALLTTIINQPRTSIIILYTEESDHCIVTGLDSLPQVRGILTTVDAMVASSLAKIVFADPNPRSSSIVPDLNSYTNRTITGPSTHNPLTRKPTTAVAMVVLYAITGVITSLFLVVIITGAIRAHRHPERYGRRALAGRGRQSRARGIARAMLDTIPIVKFGDDKDPAKEPEVTDVEMTVTSHDPTKDVNKTIDDKQPQTEAVAKPDEPEDMGADDSITCSICTEDFNKGDQVRVLPCNHMFHPDCVDPWLLNVSGTCPLCRVDLCPAGSENPTGTNATASDGELPPPLDAEITPERPRGRRNTIINFVRMAAGSTREERLVYARRVIAEHRTGNLAASANSTSDTVPEEVTNTVSNETEQRNLSRRLRERFHVRTMRRGSVITPPTAVHFPP